MTAEPYRICTNCKHDRPAESVIKTEAGTVCADPYSCMVRQGRASRDRQQDEAEIREAVIDMWAEADTWTDW